jgi:hydroxymethylpyrimidine/phosphomethylpyrimidine kinase
VPVALSTGRTQQGSEGPQKVWVHDAKEVAGVLRGHLRAGDIAVIKIGMLGNRAMVEAIEPILKAFEGAIVLDPVLVSTGGLVLLEPDAFPALERLASHCTLVTPNLPEFEQLGAHAWRGRIQVPVLLKGGHGRGGMLVDRLLWPDGRAFEFRHPRLDLKHSRGTGCALASAIACKFALERGLQTAVCEGIESLQASFRAQAVP